MKVGIHVLISVLLTWGISGCSPQTPVAVSSAETGHKHESHREHGHDHSHGDLGHSHHGHGEHSGETPPEARVKVGDKVPDFTVTTLDGKSVLLSKLQNEIQPTATSTIVLTFWCSTCHSCRDMEHLLAKLSKDYEGQAAIYALGANFDETTESVTACLKENGLGLRVVLDPSGHTADLFGVNRTTTTVVIDSEGVLRYCGQFLAKNGGSAEAALKAVLAGQEVDVKTTAPNGCPVMRK